MNEDAGGEGNEGVERLLDTQLQCQWRHMKGGEDKECAH